METVATKFLDKEKNAKNPDWLAQYVIPGTRSLVEKKTSGIKYSLRDLRSKPVFFEQALWRFTEDCHDAKAF